MHYFLDFFPRQIEKLPRPNSLNCSSRAHLHIPSKSNSIQNTSCHDTYVVNLNMVPFRMLSQSYSPKQSKMNLCSSPPTPLTIPYDFTHYRLHRRHPHIRFGLLQMEIMLSESESRPLEQVTLNFISRTTEG
jgi:hypothetical protein